MAEIISIDEARRRLAKAAIDDDDPFGLDPFEPDPQPDPGPRAA